jgi:hypothetical protein
MAIAAALTMVDNVLTARLARTSEAAVPAGK